jgi:hypothetical protein
MAYVVQGYISGFAQFGNPNADDALYWPMFGRKYYYLDRQHFGLHFWEGRFY